MLTIVTILLIFIRAFVEISADHATHLLFWKYAQGIDHRNLNVYLKYPIPIPSDSNPIPSLSNLIPHRNWLSNPNPTWNQSFACSLLHSITLKIKRWVYSHSWDQKKRLDCAGVTISMTFSRNTQGSHAAVRKGKLC